MTLKGEPITCTFTTQVKSFKTRLTWYLSFFRSNFLGFVSKPWLNTVFKRKNKENLKPLNCLQFLLVDAKNRTNLKVVNFSLTPCQTDLTNPHLSVVVTVHVSSDVPHHTHYRVRNLARPYNTKVNAILKVKYPDRVSPLLQSYYLHKLILSLWFDVQVSK